MRAKRHVFLITVHKHANCIKKKKNSTQPPYSQLTSTLGISWAWAYHGTALPAGVKVITGVHIFPLPDKQPPPDTPG